MAKLLSGTRIYGTATVDTQLFVSGSNAASSTITGALQVVGGIGVGGAGYFGGSVTAPSFVGNLTGIATTASLATTATNIAGGGVGSLPYQSAAGTTTMLSLGSNGYVLTAGATAPQWTAISGLSAGVATTASFLALGTAGQVPYQTSPGITSFFGPGTAGQILISNGTSGPTYVNTLTFVVGRALLADNATTATLALNANTATLALNANTATLALNANTATLARNATTATLALNANTATLALNANTATLALNANTATLALTANTATNVAGGAAGSLHYQSAAGITAMLGIATTAGYVLSSSGSLPQWSSLASLGAGSATTATNIAGGTAGQVPYQSSTGTTSFFGPGTAGQVLVSNGTSAPSYSSNLSLTTITATTFVGNLTGASTTATNADNVKTILQTANASYYPTFVLDNNTTAAYEALYTTSSFVINPQSGNIGFGNATPTWKVDVNLGTITGPSISTGGYNVTGDATTSVGYTTYNLQLNNSTANASGYMRLARTASTAYLGMQIGSQSRDGIAFLTGATTATESVRITSTGSVNIGAFTTAIARKFTVVGEGNFTDASNNTRLYMGFGTVPTTGGTGAYVFNSDNSALVFGTTNTERVRITPLGGVAFGGAANYGTAGQILQSNGDSAPSWVAASGVGAGSATTATNVTITNDTATTTPQYIAFVSTSTGGTGIKTAAISGLNYIASSGYLGIGINPPTAPVHIVSSVSTVLRFRGASTGQVGNLYSDATQILLSSSSNAEAYGILPGTNALVMKTNATDRVTVDLNGQVKVLANIESTATTTGSFVVTGGVGVSGNLYVGGLINGGAGARITGTVTATTFVGNLTGTATTATNVAGGAAGSLHYQSAAGTTAMLAISTAGYFLSVNAGATAPQWTRTLGVANGGTGVNTLTGVVYGNGTSAFTAATGPQISTALGSTNISGSAANVTGTVLTSNGGTGLTSWTAGDIPYYASGTALSKLAIGGSGLVLTSSGTAPQWTALSGLSAGTATTATNIAGGAATQIPYQSAAGVTAFSSNLTWTNSSNTFGVTGTIAATGALSRLGAVSSTAWTTTSPVFHNAGTLLTDTSSGVGTVSARVGVSLHSPNFAASNAITITDAVNLYLQAPVASTNVTITNNWGLYNQGNTYLNGNVGIGSTSLTEKLTVNGAIRAYAPDNTTINFSNVDSDTATYTNRNGRVLTSNGTNWAADGKDPILTLTRSNGGTTRGQSIGLLMHNENATTNAYSPLIGFSAISNSGSYNSLYAAIMGKKTGQNLGVDSNWNKGELHFYAVGDAYINDTPNMVINGTGVVIGATATTNKFEVVGTAGQLFSVSDSFSGTIFSANDASGIPSIEVLDTGLVKLAQYNGQVAISTATVVSGSALTVNGIISTTGTGGEIRASSEITAYYSSDARLKENVNVISNPIEMLNQIRGVYFDWTDKHIEERGGEDGVFVRKHDVGVIAQEVEAILPEIVTTRDNGYKAVRYEKIVPLLIEAIKEQQSEIDALKHEMNEIKKLFQTLKGK